MTEVKNLDWKKIAVTLPLLALGLPAVAGAEGVLSQAAGVSYRTGSDTQKESYSGYDMAVQGSTLALDLKGNAAGGQGWSVENLDPAMLHLDSQTVTKLSEEQPDVVVTRLHFTAMKSGKTAFQLKQKGNDTAHDLEAHVMIDQKKQITSVSIPRPGTPEETDAAGLKFPDPARLDPFKETHEGHLIKNSFTGEAYSDDVVILHLAMGMTQKDVEKLAKKMDCSVQYYMPILSMAALKLDKPVKDSKEMQQVLNKLNGTTGVLMADVNRIIQLD